MLRLIAIVCALLLVGCVKLEDSQVCWVQNGSKIVTAPQSTEAAKSIGGQLTYLEGHTTHVEEGTVLYVEKLRSVREWGRKPSEGMHPVYSSTQLSLSLPSDVKVEQHLRYSLSANDKLFLSRWSSTFEKAKAPLVGWTEYPLGSNQHTLTGSIVGLPDGRIEGRLRYASVYPAGDASGYPSDTREFRFSCKPRTVPPKAAEPCLGRAFAKCTQEPFMMPETTISDYLYCPHGLDSCYEKYATGLDWISIP